MTTWTAQNAGSMPVKNSRGFRWDAPGVVWDSGIDWDSAVAQTAWSVYDPEASASSWSTAASPTD